MIIEMGSYDLDEYPNRDYIGFIDALKTKMQSNGISDHKLEINFFRGYHEANPKVSFDKIIGSK